MSVAIDLAKMIGQLDKGGVYMQSITDVAQYLYERYKSETGENLDEMKLHKLLYFAQREALAVLDEPLFNEELQGWIHGPVSPIVRSMYSPEIGVLASTQKLNLSAKQIINNVISEYGHFASWKLRELSHQEQSWKNSRNGLLRTDRGNHTISLADIKEDAKKVRPFDHTWGMYYDEFEDYDGDLLHEQYR